MTANLEETQSAGRSRRGFWGKLNDTLEALGTTEEERERALVRDLRQRVGELERRIAELEGPPRVS